MRDYGFVEGLQELSAYIFGDGNVPFIPYQEDGNWEPFLPKYETQRDNFETFCCTVFGTLNCIETLYKRLYEEEPNYSDRFTALLSGLTGTGGTDPQIPCEAIRHEGLVHQSVMPMERTRERFFDMNDLTDSIRAKGQNWLYTHDFMHEWIWRGARPENYKELMKKALKTSPLGVSVSAWREEDGVYVSDKGGNNHWCEAFKVADYKMYKDCVYVFDTYEHNIKILHPDHNIRRAKRFHLQKKTPRAMRKHISILQMIVDFLTQKKR